MSVSNVYAKSAIFGGREVKRPGRNFEIKVDQLTTTEQGVAIRLVAGTANCAGVYITPIFDFRQEEIESDAKKGGQPIYSYFGSGAQVVCFGPVDILHDISNGDERIWTGPIMRSEAMDGEGKTVLQTTVGEVTFYWGTAIQTQNLLLQQLAVDQGNGLTTAAIPAFLRVAYAVANNINFGKQTTPPTFNFTISRFPSVLGTALNRVTRARVTSQGSNYATAPTVAITGGGGSGATAVAKIKRGKVIKVTITNTGTGYTSTPTIGFSGGGGSGAAATAYRFAELDGDCILPEFLVEALTDTFWGAGIPIANINTASFLTAANTIIAEDIGASPNFDSTLSLREMVGKLLPYMDAVWFFKLGQIYLKLIRRESTVGLPLLDESDFTDEPNPRNEGFSDTANMFRLTFHDASNKWEETVEGYDNMANADIVGQSIDSQVDMPFVTRRKVAKELVKRIGIKGSKPAFFLDVRLQPEHNDKHPGDLVKVSFAKFGFVEKLFRIVEMERTKPDEPEVSASLLMEQTRDTTNDYLPPDDFFTTDPSIGTDGTGEFPLTGVTPRVQVLPSGLKGSASDGFLVTYGREDALLVSVKVFWTWDETAKPYTQLVLRNNVPYGATVIAWHQLSLDRWFLRLRFSNEELRNGFNAMGLNTAECLSVTGYRQVKTVGTPSNAHKLVGLWGIKKESGYYAIIDSLLHDIEISTGQFGSPPMKLETTADPADAPTEMAYFGARDEHFIYTTENINFERNLPNAPVNPATGLSADTDLKRRFKVTAANHKQEQALGDVTEVNFDRNDPTMDPGGTYNPDWGPVALTTYELLDLLAGQYFDLTSSPAYPDVDDIDAALGRIYEGTATDTDKLVWAPVDDVLGIYTATRLYSNNP